LCARNTEQYRKGGVLRALLHGGGEGVPGEKKSTYCDIAAKEGGGVIDLFKKKVY
jgi:hypothetical protein